MCARADSLCLVQKLFGFLRARRAIVQLQILRATLDLQPIDELDTENPLAVGDCLDAVALWLSSGMDS